MNPATRQWNNLTFIPGPNKGRYPFCHSLYLDDEVKVLVDPAADPEALKRLSGEKQIDVVLLSHYHEDHWTSRHLFPDAEVYIHRDEARPLESMEALFDFYGMEWEGEMAEHFKTQLRDFFKYEPKIPDRLLEDGDVLEFGSTHVEVIHTPGHSPGHCCFYFKGQDVLFLADYDLTRFGPWYGDRLSDIDKFIESSKRVRNHHARYKVCAHEVGVIEGDIEELWEHYLEKINIRQRKLEEALREGPKTIEEIIDLRILYGKVREPQSFFDFGERSHMIKHLERMIRNGETVLEDSRYRLTGQAGGMDKR